LEVIVAKQFIVNELVRNARLGGGYFAAMRKIPGLKWPDRELGKGNDMTYGSVGSDQLANVPSWVPQPAMHYLAHTESGTSIRALARRAGCHASTVLRQIRSYESKRDDLLVDEGLRRLGRQVLRHSRAGSKIKEANENMIEGTSQKTQTLTDDQLTAQTRRVLLRLCETGAVLAVSADMDKAVVVRETPGGASSRTAVVDRAIAEAMALKSWITCGNSGRVLRYTITARGRSALSHMIAETENQALGFAEAPTGFIGQEADQATDPNGRAASGSKRVRYGIAETPLVALARRKDRDGRPFLSAGLVRVGERLREDFELGQISIPRNAGSWDTILTDIEDALHTTSQDQYAMRARARVVGALRDLGPGLGDMALRCCCYLEGLEKAERRMGWSARSGKIVLRIALQRLKRHYDGLGDDGGLIG